MNSAETKLLSEAVNSLCDLIGQFRAYQSGWLGRGHGGRSLFVERIGLQSDIERAVECMNQINSHLSAVAVAQSVSDTKRDLGGDKQELRRRFAIATMTGMFSHGIFCIDAKSREAIWLLASQMADEEPK